MSNDHTLGRLNYSYIGRGHFSADGSSLCNLVIPFMGIKDVMVIATGVTQPNARRMAACWNRLAAFSTEAIEKDTVDAARLSLDLDAGKRLLREVLAAGGPKELRERIAGYLGPAPVPVSDAIPASTTGGLVVLHDFAAHSNGIVTLGSDSDSEVGDAD